MICVFQEAKKKAAYKGYFLKHLGYLEAMLTEGKPFILGDKVRFDSKLYITSV